MLKIFIIPKKGCIPGKNIPILSFHMGCLGDPEREFPDSGSPMARIGARRRGPGPCAFREISPLQFKTHNLWKSTVVCLSLGYAAFAVATSAAQAQTYYYPSTAGTYPVAPASTTTPVYYTPATYTNQPAWNGYAPLYYQAGYNTPVYQATYAPQAYQPTYTQPTYVTQAVQPAATGPQYVQTSYVQPTQEPAATAAATAPAMTAPAGDPYGFLNWLNATRASYGLSAVGYDPNLEAWAAQNSAQQASSGIGHFVMGPARRQNSAMGGFPGIESMWMASPAHRAALLDPTIQWIGIAAYGAYWTFNAY